MSNGERPFGIPRASFTSAIQRIDPATWKSVRDGIYIPPNIPDGVYRASVMSANCGVTRTMPPVPWLRIVFEIADGPCKGERPAAFLRLYDPKNPKNEVPLRVLLSQLAILRFDITKLRPEDIVEVVETLNNTRPMVEIWVRTRVVNGRQYQDVRVNRMLDVSI